MYWTCTILILDLHNEDEADTVDHGDQEEDETVHEDEGGCVDLVGRHSANERVKMPDGSHDGKDRT